MRSCKVIIGDKKYHATLDDFSRYHDNSPGNLFLISESPEGEIIGCIGFYVSITTMAVWGHHSKDQITRDTLGDLFLLLLPHIKIPADIQEISKRYPECFPILLSTRDTGLYDGEMVVRGEESPEKLVKKIVYSDNFTDQEVRNQILQVLYNHWLESHNTKLLTENVEKVLFIPQNIYARNLDILIQKKFVDPLIQNDKIISISITQKGVEYVENGFQEVSPSTQIIQIMGDQIKTTVTGSYNIVNIKGELNQFFLSLESEVEVQNPKNKDEVLKYLTDLKSEMEGENDYNKIQAILKRLKETAGWLHEKIIKHPVVAQVIATAVAKQLGMGS